MKRKAIVCSICAAYFLVMALAIVFQRRDQTAWALPQCQPTAATADKHRLQKQHAWGRIENLEAYIRRVEDQERTNRTAHVLRHLRYRRFGEAYQVFCGKPSRHLAAQRRDAEELCREWGTPPKDWRQKRRAPERTRAPIATNTQSVAAWLVD